MEVKKVKERSESPQEVTTKRRSGSYRDPKAKRVQQPRGAKAEGYGDHHEDKGQPVDVLQRDPQVLGGLDRHRCKGEPQLGRTKP